MEIEQVKNKTIANLKQVIEELKNIHLVEEASHKFNTKEIFDSQFVELFLKRIEENINHSKYKYIYTFTIIGNPSLDSIYNRYKETKENKKEARAYARLNRKSPCLYVGSSKEIVSRVKQHLGYGPQGTFAMQLIYWCKSLNLDIDLNIYSFDSEISLQSFQAFEDGAWRLLKPMLGRQGQK